MRYRSVVFGTISVGNWDGPFLLKHDELGFVPL
jgi:hypothetical protein